MTLRMLGLGGAALAAATLLLTPQTAHAADANGFGEKGGQLILSADRLVPMFSYASHSLTRTEGDTTVKTTTHASGTSLLWGRDLGVDSVHTVPRVAFDFTVIPHLTLGGAIAFGASLGGSTDRAATTPNGVTATTTVDAPSTTVFGVAPRVGYILPLNDVLALWLRGGFSFYTVRAATEDDTGTNRNSTRDNVFSIDLDPQLAIVPLEHFFFLVGPVVNVPLTGSETYETVRGARTTTTSGDLTVFHFGVSASIGGWFNL